MAHVRADASSLTNLASDPHEPESPRPGKNRLNTPSFVRDPQTPERLMDIHPEHSQPGEPSSRTTPVHADANSSKSLGCPHSPDGAAADALLVAPVRVRVWTERGWVSFLSIASAPQYS